MNILDNFNLAQKLLDLPWYLLIVVAILIIPIFLAAWITVFNTLNLKLLESYKSIVVLAIIVIYLIVVFTGKYMYENEKMVQENRMVQNLDVLLKANKSIMGFKRIQERYPAYNNELLQQIAERHAAAFEIVPIASPNDSTQRDPIDPYGLRRK